MKRIIVAAPASITLDQLTTEQQLGLEAVLAQFVMPMPGTIQYGGQHIIDCVMKDNFDPQAIADLGLPFTIMGYWTWDGSGAVQTVTPLDTGFINFLPDRVTYDEEVNEVSRLPPALHLPHSWAGWPAL
jgi:hypothetical protein